MNKKDANGFLFLFFLVFCNVTFSHANLLFNGKWVYSEYIPGDKRPYSVFDISLSEGDDGNIHGAYCFVTQYGNRIDCSPDGELNMRGHAIGSSRKASVIFYSFLVQRTVSRSFPLLTTIH
jgi:hypothetical protein